MATKVTRIDVTEAELDLLVEALDSHEYWQLSDQSQRNNGYSLVEDGESEEIDECRKLYNRLVDIQRKEGQ